MGYRYKIISIDKSQRWIFIQADEWDTEDPDSFISLLKRVCEYAKGETTELGDARYKITGDPCNLIYQWDSLFGITIIYPPDVSKDAAVGFLAESINVEMEDEHNG